ncbi:MAG: hypothetical protein ACREAA_07615 [Candidatus Polarisedimenticolia bacterium]
MAALSPSLLHASQVRPVDLEQMTSRAARIFSGRCTGSRVERDPTLQRDVVVATFRVQRAVKGVEGHTVTVRMLASPSAAQGDEAPGVPSFKTGEEVVLFLYGDSPLGLTSPVGLGQGRFRIFKDKQGRKVALNDFANARLIPAEGSRGGAAVGKHRPPAPIDPDDLLDRAARIAGGRH